MEPHCHRERCSLCFLNCQSAPVDYSWLQRREKLISAVRSLCRSSDRAQGDTNWHKLCRKMHTQCLFGIAMYLKHNKALPPQSCPEDGDIMFLRQEPNEFRAIFVMKAQNIVCCKEAVFQDVNYWVIFPSSLCPTNKVKFSLQMQDWTADERRRLHLVICEQLCVRACVCVCVLIITF